MSDIAFSVIVNNNGIDDIVFKTIMLKGDKGNSVDHVEKTSTSGLVDTYTIYLTDGTIGGTFTVTNGAPVNIDDTVTAIDKTWSSSKLSGMIKSIDDNVVDADKLWSSQKINSMLAKTGTIEDVAIASFSDGADDVPLSELTVDIEAWQEGSGEPSPSNERAIHGWTECNLSRCGVNLWDEEYQLGEINSSGVLVPDSTHIASTNYIRVAPNTIYTLVGIRAQIGAYDNNKAFLGIINNSYIGTNGGTTNFTTPNNCYYLLFNGASSYGTTYNNDISINYPATDTEYHAHDGGTDTIDLTETVYGGTLNVATGLMTVEKAIVDMGTINFSNYQSPAKFVYVLMPFFKSSSLLICSQYKQIARADIGYAEPYDDSVIGVGMDGKYLFVKDVNRISSSGIQSSLNNVKLVFELSTPETIQLTPTQVRTLLGANNIYADTGNVEKIVYFKTGSEPVARMIEAYMRAQPET